MSEQVSVFVVSKIEGHPDDRYTTVLQAFTNKSDADHFCKRKNNDVVRIVAMQEVVSHMMQPWYETHHYPEYSPNAEDYVAYNYENAVGAYNDGQRAEMTRIEDLTGFTKARDEAFGPNCYDFDYIAFHVSEVPLTSR